MHPQMQQVFIKYLMDYYHTKLQGLITTHSNEMVRTVGLSHLRVIRHAGNFKSKLYDLSTLLKDLKKSENLSDKELANFFDWFFEIGYSEIVFADKVIFYEGDTERLFIRKAMTLEKYKKLSQQYVAFIQVGGAYAKNYEIVRSNITMISYNQAPFNSLYRGALGHDDLISFTRLAVERFPVIKKKISDKYQVVFIDEYQDTATDVLQIFYSSMIGKKSKLYLLGDKMQQIYRNYNGEFETYFNIFNKSINLSVNYRTTPKIVSILNKIYNDECYKQTAYEKNKDENMDFLPEVRIVTDIEKNVSELMEQYKDSLILYLSNKSRFYNIGVGELYDAYSGMEKYSFGKKYNAVDVLTKEEIRENDALLSFLFTVNIIVDYFTKEFYGEVFRIIRKAGTYFNCEEFSIRKHIDKHLVKDKLDDIVALYNELSTTVDDFLSLCVEKKYIREEFYSAVVEENDYQLVKNVKVQEVKVLADYMSDPKISTQHGVKGESHDTVVFVADNSRSNPVVHMSKFFEMWSNIDITLSEFDAFYYIYSQMLNQIENKIGMKCSQLKADTYISVASIIDEELQAFTKKMKQIHITFSCLKLKWISILERRMLLT